MSTITTILGGDTMTSSRTVINTNFTALNADKIETSVLDADTALAANSDLKVPTQKAVKAYVDALGGLTFLVPTGAILPYGGATAPSNFLNCDGAPVSRSTYSSLFTIIGTSYGVGNGSTTFNLPDLKSSLPLGSGTGTWSTTFLNTDVVVATEIITVPTNNSLYNGTVVRLTTTGTLPTGLSLATDYFVIRLSATTIQLASSLANALAQVPIPINITAQGTGTNTITVTLSTRTLGQRGGEELRSLSVSEMPSHKHDVTTAGGGAPNNFSNIAAGTGQAQTVVDGTTTVSGNTPHNIMNPFVVVNYIIKI